MKGMRSNVGGYCENCGNIMKEGQEKCKHCEEEYIQMSDEEIYEQIYKKYEGNADNRDGVDDIFPEDEE